MSDNIWSWRKAINQCDEISSTTAHVLLVISCYINDMGTGAYPTVETLVKDTKLSKRSVITHLQKAREMGFLRIKKHGFAGQKWARNEYFAIYPDQKGGASLAKTGENERKGGASGAKKVVHLIPKAVNLFPEGGASDDQKAVQEVHPNIPVNIPVNSVREVELDFEFNRTVHFGSRRIGFPDLLNERDYQLSNDLDRVKAIDRAKRKVGALPDCWPEVDRYVAMSNIRARAEAVGLVHWFTTLARLSIGEMRWVVDGFTNADVDKMICSSGFVRVMEAFEAVQDCDAA